VKAAWEKDIAAKIAKSNISIDASFSLDLIINRSEILRNTQIRAVVIGGNATGGASLVDVINDRNALTNFIKEGANYSKNNPGLPISYVLRRVSDNSVFRGIEFNEFIIRDCKKNLCNFKLTYFRSVRGDNDRVYGEINVTLGYNRTGLTSNSFTAFYNSHSNPILLPDNNPKTVENLNTDILLIDPKRVDEAFVLVEFKNFIDLDAPNEDDRYTDLTIR